MNAKQWYQRTELGLTRLSDACSSKLTRSPDSSQSGAATMPSSCSHSISRPPSVLSPLNSTKLKLSNYSRLPIALIPSSRFRGSTSKCRHNILKFCCFKFKHEESFGGHKPDSVEDRLAEDLVKHECGQSNVVKEDWISDLNKAADAVFNAEPWTVPWTAKTIVQVMLLWIASFWFVGSWVVPFLAHTAGFRKESLTYRGQALYSLLTDVAEGLAGTAIIYRCLERFRPLPSDWFRFSFKGKWQIDVGLGCLMFPLVNQLSQVNLNLLPILPSAPVTISNVEQSIVARDPVAMAMYAVVVSVFAPIWEEIVFRGFLLPSLTKYMPIWCSILVSSIAFALAHFNMQRMLPLVFLGVVMGAVFARSRNLFASMLLHSLWNAFVFLDLMK